MIPIRFASALPDSPAATRSAVSRAAKALRLTLSGFGGGTVKVRAPLLLQVALEVWV